MQRLIFWGIIVIAVILLLLLFSLVIYGLFRIILPRHTAQVAIGWFLTALVLIVSISTWWGSTRTRLQIEVNEVEVISPRLPQSFDGFRIAQISDLHLSSFSTDEGRQFLTDLAEAIEAAQPDIIVFTGDLVTLRSAEVYPFRTELSHLSHLTGSEGQAIPLYSVLGNHDYAEYEHSFTDSQRRQDVDSLIEHQTQAGWQMLNNAAIRIGRMAPDSTRESIILAGVENIGEPPFSVYGDLGKALQSVGGKEVTDSLFTVLLSHNPTHWRHEVLPQTQIDLTLSGHTHAMQFCIAGWSPSQWKYPEWSGLHRQGDQYLYVNTGSGCVGPSVRIGVKPEVSILRLRTAN